MTNKRGNKKSYNDFEWFTSSGYRKGEKPPQQPYSLNRAMKHDTINPSYKKVVESVESMTKEEMQRYLIQQSKEGKTELEAYRNLMLVLGIEYPKNDK